MLLDAERYVEHLGEIREDLYRVLVPELERQGLILVEITEIEYERETKTSDTGETTGEE